MSPEFPYRGRYSVKCHLEVPMTWNGVVVGYVYGQALAHEDGGDLNEVVICDAVSPDDETKWIAVSATETGPLEHVAKTLWTAAESIEVRLVLEDKYEMWEWMLREAAAEFAADCKREDALTI